MGAGASTTETEPRSRLRIHQSARRLGPRYRLATTYGVDAALLLTKASKTAGRLRRVAARAPAPDDDWAARERRRAVDVERRLLCRELHEVATYDKYFPRARAFVAVTIFLNHDGEGVAAASRGAAPIAFRAADLPGARPRPELPDDLHAPPDAVAVAPLLQSGNVLTIASEDDALALALVDAPYEPAYLRFAPRVLRDVERRTRGAPPPPPLAADRDRFDAVAAGLADDLAETDAELRAMEASYFAGETDEGLLHRLQDAPPPSPTKRRLRGRADPGPNSKRNRVRVPARWQRHAVRLAYH